MTGNTRAFGRFATVALVVTLLVSAGLGIARPDVRPAGLMRDFNAFYCAGRAIARGADPYRAEPLGGCEREAKPEALLTIGPGLVMPAPLPPYALLPFVALANLPYVAAAVAWSVCLLLSVALAVFALRRATGAPLVPLIAAFALGDGYAALCLGQVAPIAVAAIAVAAMLIRERRDRAAAFAVAFAMIEPHVGLPACLALFVWRPRTRVVLIGAAVLCVMSSFATAGVSTTLEYVRDVVPAHALSEVASAKQFSLTYALHRFGASDELALRIGELWYFAMVVAGIALGRTVARRTRDNAALVTIAPAIALIGGPFVHIVQMAAALPAAFVLYAHAGKKARRAIGCAILALAIPWVQFTNLGTAFVVLAPLAVAVLIAALIDRRPLVIAAGGLMCLLFVEQLIFSVTAGAGDVTRVLVAHYDPKALAEASWGLYVRTLGSANGGAFDLAKVPTIAGLFALAYAAAAQASRSKSTVSRGAVPRTDWREAGASRRIATP